MIITRMSKYQAKGRKVTTTTARTKLVVKKLLTVLIRGRTEYTEQSGSKQVDNNEEVIVLAYKGKKVATTTTFAKSMDKKLLTASAKRALRKDVRDVSVKKIWIWDIS